MRLIDRVSAKAAVVGLIALIVLGGLVIALWAPPSPTSSPAASTPYFVGNGTSALGSAVQNAPAGGFAFAGATTTTVTTTAVSTSSMTTLAPPRTQIVGASPQTGLSSSTATTFNQPGNGSLIEFFSNLTMVSPTPAALASRVVELAYSVGGYVAYQSTLNTSAYVIVRVPAADYQQVLSQIQGMGNVTSLTSNSNDVTVKYTDLNATLASLVAERNDLLKLITQSTKVNDTLAIEAQLQSVNAEINSVQSEILQTQRLITYSTITLSISRSAEVKPLSMTLSATPKSGVSPVGVTFNAIVTGGHAPYIINYNFGDGSSLEGQAVIHQFYSSGNYNVTVTATDSKGNVAAAWTLIHVSAPPSRVGFGNFGVTLETLMIQVVEGMAEIAVVVLPIALIATVVIYPFRRRSKAPKETRQQ